METRKRREKRGKRCRIHLPHPQLYALCSFLLHTKPECGPDLVPPTSQPLHTLPVFLHPQHLCTQAEIFSAYLCLHPHLLELTAGVQLFQRADFVLSQLKGFPATVTLYLIICLVLLFIFHPFFTYFDQYLTVSMMIKQGMKVHLCHLRIWVKVQEFWV